MKRKLLFKCVKQIEKRGGWAVVSCTIELTKNGGEIRFGHTVCGREAVRKQRGALFDTWLSWDRLW